MSQIKKKFILFDTSSVGVNAQVVPANFTPSNYTPTQVSSEGTDKISAHLKGIDSVLGTIPATTSGDISHTSFSITNNQSSASNVTGLAFANGTVRSAIVNYSITINATSPLFESGQLVLIQKGASWEILRGLTVGDNTSIVLTVTSAGQVQYTSANYAGFTTGKINFRAQVTLV